MNVRELIAELEDFDLNADVIVRSVDSGDVVQTSDLTEVRRLRGEKPGESYVLLVAEIGDAV